MAKKLNPREMRSEVLRVFNETRDFYTMKELEAMGRVLNISQKNVKETVQYLAQEDSVQVVKIGSISIYFVPPNTESKQKKIVDLKTQYKELSDKLDGLKSKCDEAVVDETEKLKREELSKEIKDLKSREKELMGKIGDIKPTPETADMERMQNNLKTLSNAVNRWTDNVFTSVEYTKKKLRLDDSKLINKECKIPEDLDYIN